MVCYTSSRGKSNSAFLEQEWEDMVYYAIQYIYLVENPYRLVWWKLFNSPATVRTYSLSNGHDSLNSPRQTEELALGKNKWIKFSSDAKNAVGLWWINEYIPAVIQFQESTETSQG